LIAAIDFETTGLIAGWHEPIQIAIVPLGNDLLPSGRPFVTRIRPQFPERQTAAAAVHGLDLLADAPDAERVADRLVEWVSRHGQISPLAHNWSFERAFLGAWLGEPLRDELFSHRGRDTAVLAAALNDRADLLGTPRPFSSCSLAAVCKRLGVVNGGEHDALHDALATAAAYRAMLINNF
jgi:DNA polymerase III epsilon subunit-like protein